jgi:malate dehydrogenase (oxaloacetate-decarboxylating)(NADP+)
LLGYPEKVKEKIEQLGLTALDNVPVVHPSLDKNFDKYVNDLFTRRQRKGVTLKEAERLMADPDYFAAMMVKSGDADGLVTGATQNFAESVRPILQTIGKAKDSIPAGLNLVLMEDRFVLMTDTTINFDPTAEQCAQMALQAARVAEYFNITPKIAMLSYSNFGGKGKTPLKMRRAAELVRAERPDLMVDGDMQADTAVNPEIVERIFPFCEIKGGANILVFPNLESSNMSYKLIQQLGKGEVIGPFLMGVKRSANVLQRTTTVDAIVNSVVLTALEAQYIKETRKKKS